MSGLSIGDCDPNKVIDLSISLKFSEFKKIISREFADMVDDEVITEWQAGYFFALLLCYYNERSDTHGIKPED